MSPPPHPASPDKTQRSDDTLRDASFQTGFARHAEGSCVVRMGGTEVLCTASVEGRVPGFLRGKGEGWVTAGEGSIREEWVMARGGQPERGG